MSRKAFNGLSGSLEYMARLNRAAINILAAIAEATTSNSDKVTVVLDFLSSGPQTFTITTFGSLQRKLQELERQIRSVDDINRRAALLPGSDNRIISEPSLIDKVDVPTRFYSKPNWYFENLLNPYLFVELDVSKYVRPESRHIPSVQFVIEPSAARIVKV